MSTTQYTTPIVVTKDVTVNAVSSGLTNVINTFVPLIKPFLEKK